jgi:predicted TPR repeat methyltransferase
MSISYYYDKDWVQAAVARGEHRALIGGMWDEIGRLQFNFLRNSGLTPSNRLFDIGCGSLRLGVHAIDYLASANYWGTDLNQALLDAGYEKEIVPAGLADKLPRSNLVVDEEFTFTGIPNEMDFVIATSVFTHLPLNHMRVCLVNLARHITSPCTFFFTVFTPSEGSPITEPFHHPRGGVVTYSHRDPYHYNLADLHHAAVETPWSVEFIGDWNHPRNQMMVRARKT